MSCHQFPKKMPFEDRDNLLTFQLSESITVAIDRSTRSVFPVLDADVCLITKHDGVISKGMNHFGRLSTETANQILVKAGIDPAKTRWWLVMPAVRNLHRALFGMMKMDTGRAKDASYVLTNNPGTAEHRTNFVDVKQIPSGLAAVCREVGCEIELVVDQTSKPPRP